MVTPVPTVPISTQLPPMPWRRSTLKPDSFVELSTHVSLADVGVSHEASRLAGAAGATSSVVTAFVTPVELPDVLNAFTR